MIRGIGCDIVKISRVEKNIKNYSDKFLQKIFTENEIEYSSNSYNAANYFAKRFAAKEAYAKATGTIRSHPLTTE